MAWTREQKRAYQNVWKKRKRRGPRGGEVRESERRYRARRAGVVVEDLPTDWEAQQLHRQGFRCFWCGHLMRTTVRVAGRLRIGYEADHVVPLEDGGAHSADNLVLACMGCNARRGGEHRGNQLKPASTEDEVL